MIQTFIKTLSITNPFKLVREGYETSIENRIISELTGKCFQDFYIIKIDKILNITDPVHLRNSLEGVVNINVEFTAYVEKNIAGDVFCGVEIYKIKPKLYLLQKDGYKLCYIEEENVEQINMFNVGDSIPITIIDTLYKSGDPKIIFSAKLFIPQFKNIYYKLEKTSEILNYNIISNIYSELKQIKFNKLLYVSLNENIETIELNEKDYIKKLYTIIGNSVVTYNDTDVNPIIYYKPQEENTTYPIITIYNFIILMINSCLKQIELQKQFVVHEKNTKLIDLIEFYKNEFNK